MSSTPTTPAFQPLAFLAGDWDMALSDASSLPEPGQVVHGRAEVRPVKDGGFVVLRQFAEVAGPPAATWLIGRDESRSDDTVLHADSRGISRVYRMSLSEDRWRIWREDPSFSQRFEATIGADEIIGRWEKRVLDGSWEHDFNLTLSRSSAPKSSPA